MMQRISLLLLLLMILLLLSVRDPIRWHGSDHLVQDRMFQFCFPQKTMTIIFPNFFRRTLHRSMSPTQRCLNEKLSFCMTFHHIIKVATISKSCRCQFHQHFTYKFFVRTSFRQLFFTYMWLEESCQNNFRTKNSYVKCWWNSQQDATLEKKSFYL